jgi:peptidoglycan/LPS O-acetylase OafA/YrhL
VENEINKQHYFVNLDAMRFFAAFAVLLFHYFAFMEQQGIFSEPIAWVKPVLSRGHLGVNFFFVLSAFLISLLVFREIEKYGNFSIRYFLIRRTLRIWPLYFLVISISFIVVHQFPIYGETAHQPIWHAFFLANFSELIYGQGDAYTQLTIPWSVAIEEQFYLFWAFVIGGFSLKKKRSFLLLFSTLLLFSLVFRFFHYQDERALYYHTFSAVTDLSIGALLAYLFHFKFAVFQRIFTQTKPMVFVCYTLIIFVLLFKNKLFHYGQLIVLERPIIAISFSYIIGRQLFKPSLLKGKLKQLTTHFGKISYGIYMYHCLTLFFVEIAFQQYAINEQVVWLLLLAFIFTVILSHLSYRYFESYFLQLKKTYQKGDVKS